MQVSIFSLNKTLFQGEAEKILARTPDGQICVMKNHIPLISPLAASRLVIIDANGKKNGIEIKSGFLEVRPQSEVVILAEV